MANTVTVTVLTIESGHKVRSVGCDMLADAGLFFLLGDDGVTVCIEDVLPKDYQTPMSKDLVGGELNPKGCAGERVIESPNTLPVIEVDELQLCLNCPYRDIVLVKGCKADNGLDEMWIPRPLKKPKKRPGSWTTLFSPTPYDVKPS
ncbi:MAG: hypothetical protein ACI9T8_000327 [Candidatus Saccharimonadales bacterium]|jgi:hypothetical protein